MQLTLLKGYPDLIGRRQAICGYGTGPAVYNNVTGDVITIPGYERYIDAIFGGVLDTTGVILAHAKPSGSGARQTWALFYTTLSTGLPLANASTAASGLIFQVGGFAGEY
jgi:hypothetical protein